MPPLTIVKSEPLSVAPPIGPHPEARMGADPAAARREALAEPLVVHALSPEAERTANAPLVKLTGIEAVDATLTSPISLATFAALGIPYAARAAWNGLALAASQFEPALAAKIIKHTVGVASPRATHALELGKAVLTAADQLRAEPATAAPAPSAAAPVEAAAAPTAAAPVAAGPRAISPQQTLNEEAIAARRAAARPVPPPAEPVVPASGQMQLTAPELTQFTRLVGRGMSRPDALEAVRAMRELASRLGGATDAEVTAAIAARR